MPDLVKDIVKGVVEKLGRPALPGPDKPVDLQWRMTGIKQQLADHDGSIVLGLYGMGGIGKTTLATAVYNDLTADFVGDSCFLRVGRNASHAELLKLQRQMLKELFDIKLEISDMISARQQLEQRMGSRRVLLVIDDVWNAEQLDVLLVSVAPGSRVVVTTRREDLLRRPVIHIRQQVELLSERAALELFCWHAFLAEQPPEAHDSLARKAARACSGLPLALVVMGSHLWDMQDVKAWQHALSMLQTATPFGGGSLDDDLLLWGKLKLSFDTLNAREQQMFLDIACFMLGKDAIMSVPVWGEMADSTLTHLRSRSLVGLDEGGCLSIHDQLRDLGRAIVAEESIYPSMRSRVWMPEALTVITRGKVRFVCHPWHHCCAPHLELCFLYACAARCAVHMRLPLSGKGSCHQLSLLHAGMWQH